MTRPTLEIVYTPPFQRVYYRALEAYLSSVYHLRRFNILRATGASHGVCPEYHIGEVIPPHLQADAARIRTGARCRDLGLALTVLCADKCIPAGRYIIDTHQEQDPIEVYKSLLQRTLDPIHLDCVRFKERHRSVRGFRKKVRVIDRSLIEWLKREQPEEL